MKFTAVISAAVLLAGAAQAAFTNGTSTTLMYDVTTTEVVTEYTTYCPYATTFTEGNSTYTVTEATTLTITNCPCTRTSTYTTSTVTVCPCTKTSSATTVASSTTAPAVSTFTGAANKAQVAGGAVAGAVAIAAYLL
ncbi:uncharacterized protein V1518DRAFT_205001 [Limtongia smithiae]|uniref:uncharacterized protein n=1 Tax=Limtongia smithiae TaxID=1125753 RepID=UPI0034CDF4ED